MKRMRWIAAAVMVMVSVLAVGSFAAAQEGTPEPQTETSSTGMAFLGVRIAEDSAGARVIRVVPVSAAAEAGVLEGDVITAVNGEAVTAETLADEIATFAPGTEITLDVLRDGETLQLAATLGEVPARGEGGFGRGGEGRRGDGGRSGDRFEFGMLPFLGVNLGVEDGILTVNEVVTDSPAAQAGLQTGDQIISVNGTAVDSMESLLTVLAGLQAGDVITLEINRAGETVTLEATLADRPVGMGGGMPGVPDLDAAIMFDMFDSSYTVFALAETSPLYEAGLREGDRILTIDGATYDPLALGEYLAGLAEDATVTVRVLREGATTELIVPAAALNEATSMFGHGAGMREGRAPFEQGRPFGGAPVPPDTTPEAPGDYNEGGA